MTEPERAELVINQLIGAAEDDPGLAPFYEFQVALLKTQNRHKDEIKATLELADEDALDIEMPWPSSTSGSFCQLCRTDVSDPRPSISRPRASR